MAEPVSLEEALAHVRVDSPDEDALIEALRSAAREHVEAFTGLTLTEREITDTFNCFGYAELSGWPIAADATVALEYVDGNGVTQTQAGYRLLAGKRPARLMPSFGESWPAVHYQGHAVTATYTAGYPTPEDVPQSLKQAILGWLQIFYERRAPTDDERRALDSLCWPHRLLGV